ncbi:MAG: hypothetical protein K2K92_03930 [Duncaniella sp.]|nr:hypothetical protein [Duncaniella sp.]
MTKEQTSMWGVNEFLEAHNLKDGIISSVIITKVLVEYKHNARLETGMGEAYICVDNMNYGKINIISDKFDADTYFTEFLPRYQDMRYDASSGKLVISGSGPKLGAYTVSLLPLNI